MMRPFTCLCLLAALGSGLYLYQEKHRAQMLDREIGRTVKQADATRDRIGLLRAEWALLNEHDRLSGLAAQHLALQSLAPTQFAQLSDLPNRLPAPMLTPPPAPVDDPQLPLTVPMAAAAPVSPARPSLVAVVPVKPAAVPAQVQLAAAVPAPPPPASVAAKPLPVQLAAARPAPRHLAVAKPEADAAPRLAAITPKPEPDSLRPAPLRPVYAPIVPAYQPGQPLVHAPTIQSASATTSTFAASAYAPPVPYSAPSAFVGSALGMARTGLAAPIPVSATPGR